MNAPSHDFHIPTVESVSCDIRRLSPRDQLAILAKLLDDPADLDMAEELQDALLRTSGQFTADWNSILGSVEDEYGYPRDLYAEAQAARITSHEADIAKEARA